MRLLLRAMISRQFTLKPSAALNPTTRGMHSSFSKIGTREVVGFGLNGEPTYCDSVMFPYPAIRFKEITSSLKALKEKEKGNWRSLTTDEKKCLYRLSFCQTLAEADASTGEWKQILAGFIFFVSLSLWIYMIQEKLLKMTGQKLPDTFSEHKQVAQLKRMLDLRVGTIDGLSAMPQYKKYIIESEKEED